MILYIQYKESDFSAVDVSNAEQVEKWSKRVIEKYGSPDLLICNAGVAAPKANLEDVSVDSLHKMIDVNVKGVIEN